MTKNLVIVESPAKSKTISKFLGKDFTVMASMGHVRDLPRSTMGIDVEHEFEPKYMVSPDKQKVIAGLKKQVKKGTIVWIATDEDREGEAIGWHLLEALKIKPKDNPSHRIVFHEITKSAILNAVENPREINENLVNAQQARRVLDRLVGYELSPLLWKKVRYGLSAGRVQSVAVRLIVEREREILAFEPTEFWRIKAVTQTDKKEEVTFEVLKESGKKIVIPSEKEAKHIESVLRDEAPYKIDSVEKKKTKRNPAPPFTTSTLQQEASRKLGFSVKKTMMIAQQLYEGIDIGHDHIGLITYMRTDSVNLANEALNKLKELITKEYGERYALEKPRYYKGKKGAQEAHEAIRPTHFNYNPAALKKVLSKDQYRLYELIWKRTLACQMAEAQLDQTTVIIEAKKYTLKAHGQIITFDGFFKVYTEGRDEDHKGEDNDERTLPELKEGDELKLKQVLPTQHFTKPPARYTEASLVKKLEAEGIGRPSTYAPTIATIESRGYVEKMDRKLHATDIAMVVTDLLKEHFQNIVDYKFTAKVEEDLDLIAHGKEQWVPMIRDFYTGFHKKVEEKTETLKKEDVLKERIIGKDPESGKDVIARHGRFGPYVQIGEWSEEDRKAKVNKPRRASLPKDTFFETVTLEEALEALSLPKELGKHKGELVVVNVGPYGPYLKVGKANVSLPEQYDPHSVQLKDVKEIIEKAKEEKKKFAEPIKTFDNDPVSGNPILVKRGRYGPYVTDGKTNAALPKGKTPQQITYEIAVELLAKKRKPSKK